MLKSVALFWLDFLVEDPSDGSLIVSPSYSPENGDFTAAAAISQQIVTELLSATSEAADLAGETDTAFVTDLSSALAQIDPGLRVGSWGQLQEWKVEQANDSPNNHHRHVSHLYALFPGSAVSPAETPVFADAAQVSLQGRGDGGTGWSKAWKINFWARLLDGDHSYKMLTELLNSSTLDNLWDDHPPFQIDGNFGATSGIAEMLLQSQAGRIDVLPALPSIWPNGSYSGLKARGNVEVDATWQDGSVRTIGLTPARHGELRVACPLLVPGYFTLEDARGRPVNYEVQNDVIVFQARGKQRYQISADVGLDIEAPYTAQTGDEIAVTVEVATLGDQALPAGTLEFSLPSPAGDDVQAWSATPLSVDVPAIAAGNSESITTTVTVGTGSETPSPVTATYTAGELAMSVTAVITVRLPDPCPVPEPTGTLVAWDLGEDTLEDYSGNGHTPEIIGDIPVLTAGPTGLAQALSEDGYVASADEFALGYLRESTFAGEFYIDSDQSTYRRLFDHRASNSDSDGIMIDTTSSNRIRVITAGIGTTTGAYVPTDQWFSLAVTLSTSGVISVYVDGVLQGTSTIMGYQVANACTSRKLHIGANRNGGERQSGAVDRLAIFPWALSAAEVSDWQSLVW